MFFQSKIIQILSNKHENRLARKSLKILQWHEINFCLHASKAIVHVYVEDNKFKRMKKSLILNFIGNYSFDIISRN